MRHYAPLLLCLFLACEESPPPNNFVGSAPDGRDPSGIPPEAPPPAMVTPPPPDACPDVAVRDPGPALVRRMTRLEYDNTVRDLLGTEVTLARAAFVAEEESLGFDNNARALQVAPLHAEQFMEAAEELSGRVVARLDTIHPCEVRDRACATSFIDTFGRRAWRRPIEDAERLRLLTTYDAGAQMDGDAFENGLQLITQALLQSPHFLYRIEVGVPVDGVDGLNRLTDYELASRLSYLVWRSMPDDALLDAAEAGELGTPDALAMHLERMLTDERATDALWTFFEQWLDLDEIQHLEKDRAAYPLWNESLRGKLGEESRRFVNHVVWTAGDLRDLYTADYALVDRRLASHYALPPVPGNEFQKVAVGPQRRGILTQGALMAATSKPNQTSPVLRGVFVRERLLCTALPPPPPDVAAAPPDPDPSLTTRERFAEHTASDQCSGCHRLIDPVGFGFENFDALGRYRDTENGLPVDSSGDVVGTFDLDGDFVGAAELAEKLSASEQAQRCVTLQAFRFAFGRGENPVDTCAVDAAYTRYVDSGYRLDGLLEAIVRSDAFRYRRAQSNEAVVSE